MHKFVKNCIDFYPIIEFLFCVLFNVHFLLGKSIGGFAFGICFGRTSSTDSSGGAFCEIPSGCKEAGSNVHKTIWSTYSRKAGGKH